jgi:threonine 3-dehydrogenase
MMAMVEAGLDLSPVLTHRFRYTQFEEAFAVMNSGQSGKVVMDWSKEEA